MFQYTAATSNPFTRRRRQTRPQPTIDRGAVRQLQHSLSLSAGDDGKWGSLKGGRRLACLPGGGENEGVIDAITIRRTDTHFFSTPPSPPPLSTLGNSSPAKRGGLSSLSPPFSTVCHCYHRRRRRRLGVLFSPFLFLPLALRPAIFHRRREKKRASGKVEGAARAEHSQGWRERASWRNTLSLSNERTKGLLPPLSAVAVERTML